MNCRWLLCFLVIASILVIHERALAQADAIPSSWKGEADPSSHKDEILSRVQTELTSLANPATSGAARNWLRDASAVPNDPSQTSAGYRQLYAEILNQRFLALLNDPKTPIRMKINIAIVSATVGDRVRNAALLPVVLRLLSDKSNAVVLWAEKAAASQMPTLVSNDANAEDRDKLLAAIVKSVGANNQPPMAGDIASDAYWGMNPLLGLTKVAMTDAGFASLAKTNMDLQKSRMELYKSGSPDSPDADTSPSIYLLSRDSWAKLNDQDKLRALQQSTDLISMAAQRAENLVTGGNNQELIKTVTDVGYCLYSLAQDQFKNADLTAAIQKLRQISLGSRKDDIETARTALIAAIKNAAATTPMLGDLKDPPSLSE
jgi:hypothetical protein